MKARVNNKNKNEHNNKQSQARQDFVSGGKFKKRGVFCRFWGVAPGLEGPRRGSRKCKFSKGLLLVEDTKKRSFLHVFGGEAKPARPTQGLKKGRRPGAQHPPEILISSVQEQTGIWNNSEYTLFKRILLFKFGELRSYSQNRRIVRFSS